MMTYQDSSEWDVEASPVCQRSGTQILSDAVYKCYMDVRHCIVLFSFCSCRMPARSDASYRARLLVAAL